MTAKVKAKGCLLSLKKKNTCKSSRQQQLGQFQKVEESELNSFQVSTLPRSPADSSDK